MAPELAGAAALDRIAADRNGDAWELKSVGGYFVLRSFNAMPMDSALNHCRRRL